MPTREYDSWHFPNVQAAQRAMEEDAAEDERLRQAAWRRQREHDRRAAHESLVRGWQAQRERLESMVEQARTSPAQALETAREAIKAGRFDDAVTAAIGISALEHVLEVAEAELTLHLGKEPAPLVD